MEKSNPDVLIVEDEVIIALNLKLMMEEIGFTAQMVKSGEAALKISAESPPDIVLMDIALEGPLSGIDAAVSISEKKIPIIFITAFQNKEALLKAKLAEEFSYLIKPIVKEELHSEVRRIFSKKKNAASLNFS